MLSTYLTLLVFAIFSLLVPLAMLLTSKLIGKDEEHNPIKDSNYESAEAPIGSEASIMNEYLHYLTIFIAFEITLAIALLWAITSREIGFEQSLMIAFLLIFSTVLAILSIAVSKVKTNE